MFASHNCKLQHTQTIKEQGLTRGGDCSGSGSPTGAEFTVFLTGDTEVPEGQGPEASCNPASCSVRQPRPRGEGVLQGHTARILSMARPHLLGASTCTCSLPGPAHPPPPHYGPAGHWHLGWKPSLSQPRPRPSLCPGGLPLPSVSKSHAHPPSSRLLRRRRQHLPSDTR